MQKFLIPSVRSVAQVAGLEGADNMCPSGHYCLDQGLDTGLLPDLSTRWQSHRLVENSEEKSVNLMGKTSHNSPDYTESPLIWSQQDSDIKTFHSAQQSSCTEEMQYCTPVVV